MNHSCARSDDTLPSPRRVVAVDYGTRSVGLALADPLRIFAQPYGAFSQEEAVRRLYMLHEREGLEVVVVGWPLLESGAEGRATERVQQYINRLRKVLPGVRLQKWDERFTSEEARDILAQRKQRTSKARVDALAAGIILQEYLDHCGG